MNKLLLSVLCILALVATVSCFAGDRISVEERIVDLPQDQGKLYVSVVGNASDARYNEVLGWFTTDTNLVQFKSQVHFCSVTTDTLIYKERYAGNVRALPTVRLQAPFGAVVYEAAGSNLPKSATALHSALVGAMRDAGIRPVLPWRRDVDRRLDEMKPKPEPKPEPKLVPVPEPIEEPIVEQCVVSWLLAPICGLGLVVGFCVAYGRKLKEKFRAMRK